MRNVLYSGFSLCAFAALREILIGREFESGYAFRGKPFDVRTCSHRNATYMLSLYNAFSVMQFVWLGYPG